MKKKEYPQVHLTCTLQDDSKLQEDCNLQNDNPQLPGRPLRGLLSRQEEGAFLFEETLPARRPAPRPKLYSGQYVRLSRRQDGNYALTLHAQTTAATARQRPTGDISRGEQMAWLVYKELLEALTFLA